MFNFANNYINKIKFEYKAYRYIDEVIKHDFKPRNSILDNSLLIQKALWSIDIVNSDLTKLATLQINTYSESYLELLSIIDHVTINSATPICYSVSPELRHAKSYLGANAYSYPKKIIETLKEFYTNIEPLVHTQVIEGNLHCLNQDVSELIRVFAKTSVINYLYKEPN